MSFQPDQTLHLKIAWYISVVINQPYSKIFKQLPASMPRWGKVQIANCGDSIRSRSASHSTEKERDMSFVHVSSQNFKFKFNNWNDWLINLNSMRLKLKMIKTTWFAPYSMGDLNRFFSIKFQTPNFGAFSMEIQDFWLSSRHASPMDETLQNMLQHTLTPQRK